MSTENLNASKLIAECLRTARDLISRKLEETVDKQGLFDVKFGVPKMKLTDDTSSLRLIPFQVNFSNHQENIPLFKEDISFKRTLEISVLLVAFQEGEGSLLPYEILGAAIDALVENPVIDLDNGAALAEIIPQHLSSDELSRVFSGLQVPLRASIPFRFNIIPVRSKKPSEIRHYKAS